MLTRVFTTLFSLLLLVSRGKSPFAMTVKAFFYSSSNSIVNSVANLLLLITLLKLPASVQYPIVTGGTIVFSTIIVIIKNENLTKREVCAACIAFLASIFMMFV